jgi:hypothetical protein
MKPDQTKRWALLCAKAFHTGKTEIAADIMVTLTPSIASQAVAGRAKTHKIDDDEGLFLQDLREMLDETGFSKLLQCSEKRIKELERMKPSLQTVPAV